MSILLMSRIFRMSMGNAHRKLVAVRLADFADDDGRGIWPGVPRLARETELSERTIQRVLGDFEREGLLVCRERATGRQGMANRYDFDLGVLADIEAGKVTGDNLSPLPTGDNGAATGDSDDSEGCHGVTLTVIETPIEQLNVREGASEREEGKIDSAADTRQIERAFWRVIKSWPGFDGMPKEKARRAWYALTDDERDRAERKRDPWFALLKAQKKDHIPAPSTYFGEKLFDAVPDAGPVAVKASAPAFGPAWGANRMLRLLGPAERLGPPEVTRESKQSNFAFLCQSLGRERAELRYRGMGHDFGPNGELLFPDDFDERIWRDHLEANGWPAVNRMHRAAESGNGIEGEQAARGAELADMMEPVPVGSQRWDEWRAFHKSQGWPWVPDPGKQRVVYFPAGRPEEAIEAFRQRIEGNVRAAAE